MIDIYVAIDSLIQYALKHNLITTRDTVYTRNQVLELLMIDEYKENKEVIDDFELIKESIIKYARDNNIITSNGISFEDNFIARLMNIFLKLPSEIEQEFYKEYSKSPEQATKYFYHLSKATDYIKTARLSKNVQWTYPSAYGDIIMTINLAKPEKTPEEILLAKNNKQLTYPKCVLCKENEGLSGVNRAPRQNHRVIEMELDNRTHYFQYSPYSYFNEHCIVFTATHQDMNLNTKSVRALFDFVDQFDHYFLASNTDLPLVGGSILSHEHYQGGNYRFPLDKAEITNVRVFDDVKVERLRWPMTSFRIKSTSKRAIISFVNVFIEKWWSYDNEELNIVSKSGDTRHNSVNFVVRKNDGEYSIILVLRNNRCDTEHPKGIFTTKEQYRSIKNENIGIIEVLGVAILPGRIKLEIEDMKAYLLGHPLHDRSNKHKDLLDKMKAHYHDGDDVDRFIKSQIGEVYVNILKNCSVFKKNEKSDVALTDFISDVGKEYEKNNT